MAKTNVKGSDVALYFEKTAGSNLFTRVGCASGVSLDVDTEMDDVACVDSGNFAEVEPGNHSFSGSLDLTVRILTDTAAVTGPPAVAATTDATNGISADNLLDFQLQKRKLKIRYALGTAVGSPLYEGFVYITKTSFKGQLKGVATSSVSFTGTGALVKSLVTA